MSTHPSRRLPARVRKAVVRLESAFTADDDTYDAAMAALTAACVGLDPDQRAAVNDELTSARQRLDAAAFTAQVRRALAAGQYRSVQVLPGGVELLTFTATDLEQLLVTVPTPVEGDTVHVKALVAAARDAVLSGQCARCTGQLTAQAGEQLTVTHRTRCPLSEQAIARARSAAN